MYTAQPATIKDIAVRLKVAISTVSRALSDHPRIGLRTKMRVKKLALELNYEPSLKAICFKNKKTFVVGVILPNIKDDFFSDSFSGIEHAATENDYTLLVSQSHDDYDTELKAVEAMRRQQIDGLIISLSKHTRNYDHLTSLSKHNIPVVYFDRVPKFNANKVYCNVYKGTIMMINWLLGRGYRRIAMINGPDTLLASQERLQGYIDAFSKNKLKVNMQLVETTDLSKEGNIGAVQLLLAKKNLPQVIISFNDYVHMDAANCLQNDQHHHEIGLVCFGNLPITRYTASPPMASLEQYPFRQGKTAMNMMMNLLHNKLPAQENVAMTEEIAPAFIIYQKAI